jgi:iron complex outermembrane receptor protein
VLRNNEFVTENAGGLKATGFEIETILRVNSSLKVNASTTYSDAQYTDYLTSCPNSIVTAGAAAVAAQCNAPGSTTANPLYQAKGQPLAGAPKVTAVVGGQFRTRRSATAPDPGRLGQLLLPHQDAEQPSATPTPSRRATAC